MSQRSYELTDFERLIIEPLLPNKPRGVPLVHDQRDLYGFHCQLITGLPTGQCPRSLRSLYHLLQPLCAVGAAWCMGDILDLFPKSCERYEWLVDSSSIRVQQPVANPNKQGNLAGKADLRAVCMGRSRGCLMTDALVANDSNGLLTTLKLTARQAHVGRSGDDILGTIGPCQALLADAVCDSNRLRDHLAGGAARKRH